MRAIQDDDQFEVHRVKHLKARKPQRCAECRRTIAIGEPYDYDSFLSEGKWSNYRTCQHCRAAGGWLHVVCGGYVFTGLGSELAEHLREYREGAVLAELCDLFGRQWLDGAAPVPVAELVRADAKRCVGDAVAV